MLRSTLRRISCLLYSPPSPEFRVDLALPADARIELLEDRRMLSGVADPNQVVGYDAQSGVETFREFEEIASDPNVTELSIDGFEGLFEPNRPETVHGNDDRTEVADTLATPARFAVKLYMEFSNGASYIGSGIMIGEFQVLTAGHCLYSHSDGGWATSIQVYAAQDDVTATGGDTGRRLGVANMTHMRSYTGWTTDQNADYDWGLISLDRSLGTYSGWAGMQWYGDNNVFNGLALETYGYPGDLQGGRDMYRAAGPSAFATDLRIFYSGNSGMDTAGGQSGSGVLENGTNRVVGVHAYGGSTNNSAPRMTEQRFNDIVSWRDEDANTRAPNNRADLVDWDKWFSTSISDLNTNSVAQGDDVVVTSRFRNQGTAASGNFTVSYYASGNNFISTGDTFLGSINVSSLDAFHSLTQTTTITLSNSIATGTYYIGWILDSDSSVTEFDEGNNWGLVFDETLTITSGNTNPDSNDQISEAYSIAVGDTLSGFSISPTDDVDMISFNVTAGQRVQIDIDTVGSSLDSYLRLFNASGTQLASNDNGVGPGNEDDNLESFIEYTFNTGGTYYVGVSGAGNTTYDPLTGTGDTSGSTGSFTLELTDTTPPPEDSIIRGRLWNDADGDGEQDSGEAGLVGRTVYIDANDNGQLDQGETSTTTAADDPNTAGVDEAGNYSFTNLAAGTYTVRQVLPSQWVSTFPNAPAPTSSAALAGPIEFTTTGGDDLYYTLGETFENGIPETDTTRSVINLDDFRNDSRFNGIDGSGYTVVVLDTGIDLDHSFFGPDSNNDGIADRIVASLDFTGEGGPQDLNGHGSNVASIIGSSDGTYGGLAPGVNIVALKVLGANGGQNSWIESALQWVATNVNTYNIVAINMSLGNRTNVNSAGTHSSWGDELLSLYNQGVINIAAAGNEYFDYDTPGVSDLSADPSIFAVGASYDANVGQRNWASGAIDFTTDVDRIASFSQRHDTLVDFFAPGPLSTGANHNGGTVTQGGTSQAAPHIAGAAALAQHLADQVLGRRLTPEEFRTIVRNTGTTINDGDDENDNVTNTGFNFQRLDVQAMAEAILALSNGGDPNKTPGDDVWTVTVDGANTVDEVDFGSRLDNPDPNDQISEAFVTSVGSSVTSFSINPAGDVDMFEFDVTAGQIVQFDIDTFGSDLDSYIRLFDASGNQLAFNDDAFGPGNEDDTLESFLQYTFNTAGTYYLGVSAFGNSTYDPITGQGDNENSSTGSFTLDLINYVPNQAPVVNDQAFSVAENSSVNTPVGTVAASDGDNDPLTYSIVGGHSVFAIDSNTGAITVASDVLDYETTQQYTFTVEVSDGLETDTAVVTINVTDRNEAPTHSGDQFFVEAGMQNGTVLGPIRANDPDEDDLTFTIIGGNTGGAFAVDSTGKLFIQNAAAITQDYTLTVEVTDGEFDSPMQVRVNYITDFKQEIIGYSDGLWRVSHSDGTSFTNLGLFSNALPDSDVVVHGDFDRNGYQDGAVRDEVTGEWHVILASGTGFTTEVWETWQPGSATYENLTVADFNGDGRDDIAARRASDGDWRVALSTGDGFETVRYGRWAAGLNWEDTSIGDFDGNGLTDVAGRLNGNWWISLSQGTHFATRWFGRWSSSVQWEDPSVGDFNNDGRDDIAGRTAHNGSWWVSLSTWTQQRGDHFSVSWFGRWSNRNGLVWKDATVGDFNGDGIDDIAGRTAHNGNWWISRSDGQAFSAQYYGQWSNTLTWNDPTVGDFNGDGTDDIAGRDEFGRWHVSANNGSAFTTSIWGNWGTGNWYGVGAGNSLA